MLIYLDTVIVIYTIEGTPPFQARAVARLAAAKTAGDEAATSDLTRLECWVQPLRKNDPVLLADYAQFLDETVALTMPPSAYDRAARIRATYNFRVTHSLHLATALIGNCDLFLTNDARLATFRDIKVEILP